MNVHDGMERKNKNFKHGFLKPYKNNSLSGMITVLIEQFLPAKENRFHLFLILGEFLHVFLYINFFISGRIPCGQS